SMGHAAGTDRACSSAQRAPARQVGEDVTMATTHPEMTPPRSRSAKPAAGRPVLFSLLLAVAAVGVLTLLVTGPSLALPLAIGSAAALIALVALTWIPAGPLACGTVPLQAPWADASAVALDLAFAA